MSTPATTGELAGLSDSPEPIPWPRGSQREEYSRFGRGTNYPPGNSHPTDPSPPPEAPHNNDFDDGANALWSLYGKEAKSRDEAGMQTLKDDMDGVLIFAGLFSAVLTAFVVPKIQGLQEDPAQKSAYYQQQSAQALVHISQQIAAIGTQISIGSTPPLPDYAFHPSASDRRVNICWLLSLVCSLSAALLATLVQQWVRAYMRIYQPSNNTPLKTARIRQFLFEGVERLPLLAEATGGLIQLSFLLFFLGLGDTVLNINATVGFTTIVPIVLCGFLYLYSTIAPAINPQSPYRNPLSSLIWNLNRILRHVSYRCHFLKTMTRPTSMEAHREQLAMEQTEKRKGRDVRAVRWLVENINGCNEMESLVLAIPGSFNQEWGRNVWQAIVKEAQPISDVQIHAQSMVLVDIHDSPQSTLPQFYPHPAPSRSKEIAVLDLCRCVQNLFESYNNQSINKEARRRRMHGCVEIAASLVCCTDVQLGWFGEIGEVLKTLGYDERTNEPTMSSNPSFVVHWTCLSLVAIGQMVMADSNKLQELAKLVLGGIARLQSDYGSPDVAALKGAEKIDDHLRATWEHVENLRQAFEPWSINRTEEEIRGILSGRQNSISELERIEMEVAGVEDLDWKISLLQGAMDEATHNLMRQLPGVLFNDLKSARPILISEAFDFPFFDNTPATPQLIFPGQRVQSLCALGGGLRDIIEKRNPEKHQEILENLTSIDIILIPLRRLNYPIKQLWRLQDLRDGQGLGFIIELFFVALRSLSSASLSPELNKIFYTGTFKIITSQWMKSKGSSGTKRILLDLICDLVIKNRGVFSDFTYPTYIEEMLLELVRNMVDGDRGLLPHINDVYQVLLRVDSRNCMNMGLQDNALKTIDLLRRNTAPSVIS